MIVADISRALVRVAQLCLRPSIFPVVTGSIEGSALQPNVLAGGHVGAGRNNVIHHASEHAIEIGHALGTAVGIFERDRHLTAVGAPADRMESRSFHLRILAALSVWAGGESSRRACGVCAHQAAVFVCGFLQLSVYGPAGRAVAEP